MTRSSVLGSLLALALSAGAPGTPGRIPVWQAEP